MRRGRGNWRRRNEVARNFCHGIHQAVVGSFFAVCVDDITRNHHECCFYACSSLIWSFCYLSFLFFWVEEICDSFMYQCIVERTGAIFLWCKRSQIEGKNYISLLRNLNSNVKKNEHHLCNVKFYFISTNRRLNAHEVSKDSDVNSWWCLKDRRNMLRERDRKSDILTQKCYFIFDSFIFILFKNQKHSVVKKFLVRLTIVF